MLRIQMIILATLGPSVFLFGCDSSAPNSTNVEDAVEGTPASTKGDAVDGDSPMRETDAIEARLVGQWKTQFAVDEEKLKQLVGELPPERLQQEAAEFHKISETITFGADGSGSVVLDHGDGLANTIPFEWKVIKESENGFLLQIKGPKALVRRTEVSDGVEFKIEGVTDTHEVPVSLVGSDQISLEMVRGPVAYPIETPVYDRAELADTRNVESAR